MRIRGVQGKGHGCGEAGGRGRGQGEFRGGRQYLSVYITMYDLKLTYLVQRKQKRDVFFHSYHQCVLGFVSFLI